MISWLPVIAVFLPHYLASNQFATNAEPKVRWLLRPGTQAVVAMSLEIPKSGYYRSSLSSVGGTPFRQSIA